MYTAISLALLAGGIALVVFGIIATDSVASDLSRLFTGAPTDQAIWMLLGGLALIALSSFGLFRAIRATP